MLNTDHHFAFNIWNFESARAVIDAAAFVRQDVILQTSTGIYKSLPASVFSAFVKSYATERGVHACLNLDHCKEKETLFHAVNSGWDMVMADGSSLTLQQNIDFTNEIISYAHSYGVLVEAEVGQVKGIEDDVIVRQRLVRIRNKIRRILKI